MIKVEQPRSAEQVKTDIAVTVSQLQEDLRFAGDPTTGNDWKKRAVTKHVPTYTNLVFELAQLVGRKEALRETAGNTVRIRHKYNSGASSGIEELELNRQPEFVAALMDIALRDKKNEEPNSPIDTETTRSEIIGSAGIQ